MLGVPLRLEIGPKDLLEKKVRIVTRYNKEVQVLGWDQINAIPSILENIQASMFENAKNLLKSRLIKASTWEEFLVELNKKNIVITA